ncbi:MAG: hypothetical protein QOI73_863 [Solirubrobacteraceae bacterium]|nr:hypothetical protein [Solirubrobacteraceae bacterium]
MSTEGEVLREAVVASRGWLDRLPRDVPSRDALSEIHWKIYRLYRSHSEHAWRRIPRAERGRIVVEALADERLTQRELRGRVIDQRPDALFTDEYLRDLLKDLVAAGEVRCAVELPPTGGRRRAYFWRNAELSGPIADLERTFHGGCQR